MANLISLPYYFQPNTLAESSQVNADFAAIVSYINSGMGTFADTGYMVLPGGIYVQWGTVASVKADGSAASAISFTASFPNACFGVVVSVKNDFQSNPWALTVQWDTPSQTGCNVNVAGAPASDTVSIYYLAIGN